MVEFIKIKRWYLISTIFTKKKWFPIICGQKLHSWTQKKSQKTNFFEIIYIYIYIYIYKIHNIYIHKCIHTYIYIYIYIYIHIHTNSVSQKWIHPSHFCRYLSISLHGTTLTKWHFDTMKSSLCAAYITKLIYFPSNNPKYNHENLNPSQKKWIHPLRKVVNINIHHVNHQYFVWTTSLSRTVFTLLDMEFTSASWVATGMLFHSSMTTSRNWQIYETLCISYFHLRIPQRCSIGFKSGDMLGQSITFTLSLFSSGPLGGMFGSLSCWNFALQPSFWREGIMLYNIISQYMLGFMFPSMTCSTHADHDIPTTMLDC